MKKAISIILVLVLVSALYFVLVDYVFEEACIFYSNGGEKDGFDISVNNLANCCFVHAYTCDEYLENMEITVPDEFNGIPVTRMGGYQGTGVPSPFYLSLSTAPDGSEIRSVHSSPNSNEDIVKYLVFNLNIGEKLEVIEYVLKGNYCVSDNIDGSETYYLPVFNVNCSPENKYFYSKDGRLYNKKTDELITNFDYAADYKNSK